MIAWSLTTWVVSVAAVAVSAVVAAAEGHWRRRGGLDVGFADHGGMWGDLLLLPLANALIVPWIAVGWWLGPIALATGLASLGLHAVWHGGVRNGMRDHLWPTRAHGHWARDLSAAGWCHVAYVAAELALLVAYAFSTVPDRTVVLVTALLSVHVSIGLLQPAWSGTRRLPPSTGAQLAGALAAVWVVASVKL